MSELVMPVSLAQRRALLEERQKKLHFEFIEVELELAITFCEIAKSTSDGEKSQRNIAHAEQAYESVMHFLRTTEVTEVERQELEERIGRLQSLLGSLHERP